jgi:putative endonuclease
MNLTPSESEGPGRDGRHAEETQKQYYVYIATNRTRALYTGMTDDLRHRQWEHATGQSAFTARYRIDRIVYYEVCADAQSAVRREAELKGWRRSKEDCSHRIDESRLEGQGGTVAALTAASRPGPSLTLGVYEDNR